MKVYIDMIFIMHLIAITSINFISIKLVKELNIKLRKIISISCVETISSVCIYTYKLLNAEFNDTIFYILLSLLSMVSFLDFKDKKIRDAIKIFFKLLLMQIVVILISFSVIVVIIEKNYTYTFKVLGLSFFITFLICFIFYKTIAFAKLKDEYLVAFETGNKEKTKNDEFKKNIQLKKLTAFVDSGNMATYLNSPVSFIKETVYLEIIKYNNDTFNLKEDREIKITINNEMKEEKYEEWIEIKTATGIERVKLIRPKKMILEDKETGNLREINKPLFGVIRDENMPDDYDVILNKKGLL